ncbi:MAG: DUF882 domain-containing protein [Gammaproteobacteria bacterium]|nr:DUF882 domain-containing protein [Gammaproteobacteria bacterium]
MQIGKMLAGARLRAGIVLVSMLAPMSLWFALPARAAAEDNWSASLIAEGKAQQRAEAAPRQAPRRGVRVAALGSAAYNDQGVFEERRPSRSRASSADRPRSIRNSDVLATRPYSRRKASTRLSLRSPAARRVASLGRGTTDVPRRSPNLSAGGGIRWVASAGCLNGSLRSVIASVAATFGSVTVSSTCRSRAHNRRVGGASKSWHLTGNAADFRVHGHRGGVMAFLRTHGSVGGLKHYGGGLFHIDTGPRRGW